ncbi:MAG: NAD-dependent epimerase/dehydratase family protein [Chloroflexi bacterium]|nr:NAD-dependent epimerase/dehydratase family protein [Chloroflexota bacterium]MBU1751806.1 NAD-dependent epimerase/dehydratase family protein [Chloroflexota bacterium]MBU1879351.1 NAD-dependent epimerase/dehydratase family protein [Chloroflexota bacterium]
MKKVLVIGGTGFLGTHLLPRLLERGHDVTVLARSRDKVVDLESRGIRGVPGDLLQPKSFMAGLPPQDVVVSIARPGFKPGRMSRQQFETLRQQTPFYFSTPIAMAERLDCPLIVTLGTSFRTTGDQIADESWPIERFGLARMGEQVDPLLAEVVERGSPPLIQMLPGEIYGPGGLFKTMVEWTKKGRYRVFGSGQNRIPRVHVDDCAEAYAQAVDRLPLGERFILADDGPCTAREFADYLADCLNVPRPGTLPGFVARIVLGKLMVETIMMDCRVSNARAKERLDWTLQYPTYREGLPATVRALE